MLAEVFLKELEEEKGESQDAKFSRSSLIEKQQADPVLKKLVEKAYSDNEAKEVRNVITRSPAC